MKRKCLYSGLIATMMLMSLSACVSTGADDLKEMNKTSKAMEDRMRAMDEKFQALLLTLLNLTEAVNKAASAVDKGADAAVTIQRRMQATLDLFDPLISEFTTKRPPAPSPDIEDIMKEIE